MLKIFSIDVTEFNSNGENVIVDSLYDVYRTKMKTGDTIYQNHLGNYTGTTITIRGY